MKAKQWVGLFLGIAVFAIALMLPMEGLSLAGRISFGIFGMAAIFWILEPIPIFATSMLIILLQVMLLSGEGFVYSPRMAPTVAPVPEIVDGREAMFLPASALSEDGSLYVKVSDKKLLTVRNVEVLSRDAAGIVVRSPEISVESDVVSRATHPATLGGPAYKVFYGALASPIIMLFLGGFALASAAVKFGLDRNITRVLLQPFGTKPAYVCLGLMVCTATLSAFMSNTATTAMMMTVVLPIVGSMSRDDPFRKGIALAIPVAANVGGIATPIGTPPNAVALAALKEHGITISFSSWMLLVTPLVIILLFISWRMLLLLFKPKSDSYSIKMEGSFNKSPKAILSYIIFAGTVILWITEKLHGISTSMIAFIPVATLPALSVLEKKDIRNFSWEVLWLVAGGISLGLSMKDTGLASWLIGQVSWDSFGNIGVMLMFGIVGYVLSNLISHTVAATMIMPLAISVGSTLAAASGFDFVASIVAITVIVSCAMVLPISTPPNAIAMSAGVLETKDMAKAGLIVGMVGLVFAVVAGLFIWPLMI